MHSLELPGRVGVRLRAWPAPAHAQAAPQRSVRRTSRPIFQKRRCNLSRRRAPGAATSWTRPRTCWPGRQERPGYLPGNPNTSKPRTDDPKGGTSPRMPAWAARRLKPRLAERSAHSLPGSIRARRRAARSRVGPGVIPGARTAPTGPAPAPSGKLILQSPREGAAVREKVRSGAARRDPAGRLRRDLRRQQVQGRHRAPQRRGAFEGKKRRLKPVVYMWDSKGRLGGPHGSPPRTVPRDGSARRSGRKL